MTRLDRIVTPTPMGAAVACVVMGFAGLMPADAAARVELPAALVGSWTKQGRAPTANPVLVTLGGKEAAIDLERCTLDGLRALSTSRWYADFTCGPASAPNHVWLDINLLEPHRMMMNRRPLAEADIYVRRAPETSGGAK